MEFIIKTTIREWQIKSQDWSEIKNTIFWKVVEIMGSIKTEWKRNYEERVEERHLFGEGEVGRL